MSARTTGTNSRYVTQEQFESLTSHVDQRFALLTDEIREIGRSIKEASRPQYSNWFAVISIVVIICGMAGTLINTSIASSSALAEAKTDAIKQQLQFITTGNNRFTIDDQKYYAERTDDHFIRVETRLQNMAAGELMQAAQLQTLKDKVSRNEDELSSKMEIIQETNERSIRTEAKLNDFVELVKQILDRVIAEERLSHFEKVENQ